VDYRIAQMKKKFALKDIEITRQKPLCSPTNYSFHFSAYSICTITVIELSREKKYLYISREVVPYGLLENFFASALAVFILGIFFLTSLFLINRNLKKSILEPLQKLENNPDAQLPFKKNIAMEICSLHQKIQDYIDQSKKEREKTSAMEYQIRLGKLSAQVAHDIRSPLTALSVAVRRISDTLDEEDRVLFRTQVQRINDIANNLLAESGRKGAINVTTMSVHLLYSCIEEIVSEKRLQFSADYPELTIDTTIDNSYGLFADINLSQFKRVLSNLINNAAESYDNKKGTIVIHLFEETSKARIIVEDFGKGIPKQIMDQLGQEGISYGKEKDGESGYGIGFHHAMATIRTFNGEINIESTVGKGTKIIILLPRANPPRWFVPMLTLQSGADIVVLDDNSGIHSVWKNRFQEPGILVHGFTVFYLCNPLELDLWLSENNNRSKETFFLCDHEFIGHERTGLDLIKEHQLKNSTLVTSRYQEESIQNRCNELNIKLLPKMLAGLIPIAIQHKEKKEQPEYDRYDVVYIEDDVYIRRIWKSHAKKNHIQLLVLSSTRDFQHYESRLNKETVDIYIDSNLGLSEPRGEDFARDLFYRGYKNLYLATSYDADDFEELTYLKGVVGKIPFDRMDEY
jgi:signal transduction histidine kinase